ncbi:MAG: hypothetical protein JJV95_06540 [Sulfurospirillum sp.]|nr:hypothetical protein [Sulfurospirillum sp.]MBL0703620.1 hypothetical protein [Sulfurospirillum sp.]
MTQDNFIYFFTVCGFFIGLIFSIINFTLPENILLYTLEITFFFYLLAHISVINFMDAKDFGLKLFDKKEYEKISDYFGIELDNREKAMDALLLEIEKMNKEHTEEFKNEKEPKLNADKKAA